MRAILRGEGVDFHGLLISVLLNAVYLLAAFFLFNRVMRISLDKGLMTRLES